MIKKAALLVGIVFLVIGLGGFLPFLVDDESRLLGIFMVDGVHNLVHIVSGLAFIAASQQLKWSRLAFQVMAVVYGLVTVLGFIVGDGEILGLLPVNTADNFLHVALTLAFLYFGFVAPADGERETAPMPAV